MQWWEWEYKSGLYSYDQGGWDPSQPLVYGWFIEGVGAYVGKTKDFTSRRRLYELNVSKALNGQPYRRSKPSSFRTIHMELAAAHVESRKVRLAILGNADEPELLGLERKHIAQIGSLNGRRIFDTRDGVRKVRTLFVSGEFSGDDARTPLDREPFLVVEPEHMPNWYYAVNHGFGFGQCANSAASAVKWLAKTRGVGIPVVHSAEVVALFSPGADV